MMDNANALYSFDISEKIQKQGLFKFLEALDLSHLIPVECANQSCLQLLRSLPLSLVFSTVQVALASFASSGVPQCRIMDTSLGPDTSAPNPLFFGLDLSVNEFIDHRLKLSGVLETSHRRSRQMEADYQVWRAEKVTLRDNVEELKHQLKHAQLKDKPVEEIAKIKKKLKDYEKKMVKMKIESIQTDFMNEDNMIQAIIRDLNELRIHSKASNRNLENSLEKWKKAKDKLKETHQVIKVQLNNHLKALENGKDIPDFESILTKPLILSYPPKPDLEQLANECRQMESALASSLLTRDTSSPHLHSLLGASSLKGSGSESGSRSGAVNPSQDLASNPVAEAVLDYLVDIGSEYPKHTLIPIVEDYLNKNPGYSANDVEDIASHILLQLTST